MGQYRYKKYLRNSVNIFTEQIQKNQYIYFMREMMIMVSTWVRRIVWPRYGEMDKVTDPQCVR